MDRVVQRMDHRFRDAGFFLPEHFQDPPLTELVVVRVFRLGQAVRIEQDRLARREGQLLSCPLYFQAVSTPTGRLDSTFRNPGSFPVRTGAL